MQPADLLARSGLAKEVRVLIGVTTTTWNADWTGFCEWIAAGRQLQIPRQAVEEALLQLDLHDPRSHQHRTHRHDVDCCCQYR